jgi:hypothetical protein
MMGELKCKLGNICYKLAISDQFWDSRYLNNITINLGFLRPVIRWRVICIPPYTKYSFTIESVFIGKHHLF